MEPKWKIIEGSRLYRNWFLLLFWNSEIRIVKFGHNALQLVFFILGTANIRRANWKQENDGENVVLLCGWGWQKWDRRGYGVQYNNYTAIKVKSKPKVHLSEGPNRPTNLLSGCTGATYNLLVNQVGVHGFGTDLLLF